MTLCHQVGNLQTWTEYVNQWQKDWSKRWDFKREQNAVNEELSGGARNFHLGGYSRGSLGNRSPPEESRGEVPGGGLWDEVPQKLKQFANNVYRFWWRNNQNLKISHNSPPDSWPICFTVGLSDQFGGWAPSPWLAPPWEELFTSAGTASTTIITDQEQV